MKRTILVLAAIALLVAGCGHPGVAQTSGEPPTTGGSPTSSSLAVEDARPGEYWTGGPQFQAAWRAFYRPAVVHEPELDDPLIAAGADMVPAICEAVVHQDMLYRRYALGALGYIGDRRALPTLQSILDDKSEESYFRDDALTSIYRIDEDLATGLARTLEDDPDLGTTAKAILAREPWLKLGSEEE
jgi:HEAT repeat protein